MYALKSSEARRQYPKRLKKLFDFLNLAGSLEEQANEFLNKARQNIQWSQDSIMKFLDFHKERVRRKEFAVSKRSMTMDSKEDNWMINSREKNSSLS